MKKALALVLAVMMVAAMGVSAFAMNIIDLTEEITSAAGTYIKIALITPPLITLTAWAALYISQ